MAEFGILISWFGFDLLLDSRFCPRSNEPRDSSDIDSHSVLCCKSALSAIQAYRQWSARRIAIPGVADELAADARIRKAYLG